MKERPIVSAALITYNQEQFIAQCIEGMINQNVYFPFEIVISDDCSTDKTRDICIEYQQKYPNLIRLLLPDQNLGVVKNWIHAISFCEGKYVALCEGDDYWADPYKLQKQFDFLENNESYTLVYHQVQTLDMSSNTFGKDFFSTSSEFETFTITDLAKGNFIHTPSVMVVKEALDYFEMDEKLPVFDYFLWMSAAEKGNIGYLPDIMAVYRIWTQSVWETKPVMYKAKVWINLMTILLKKYGSDTNLYGGLFHQLNFNYRVIFGNVLTDSDSKYLDKVTKKLLMDFPHFRTWWFSYMLHMKKSRSYKLKYLFYLITKGINPHLHIWKKAIE